MRIQAEYLGYHINWESGAFTEESLDGTEQKNAAALGAIGALAAIADDLESMQDIRAAFVEEEEDA